MTTMVFTIEVFDSLADTSEVLTEATDTGVVLSDLASLTEVTTHIDEQV